MVYFFVGWDVQIENWFKHHMAFASTIFMSSTVTLRRKSFICCEINLLFDQQKHLFDLA